MGKSVTVAELQDKKEGLEAELLTYISRRVSDFESDVGVQVGGINIHFVEAHVFCKRRPDRHIDGVSIALDV